MERQIVLKSDIKAALKRLGVHKGRTLMDLQLADFTVNWIGQERRSQ